MELPAPIPESCPGTEAAGRAPACAGCPNQVRPRRAGSATPDCGVQAVCAAPKVVDPELAAIQLRMRDIKHKASDFGRLPPSGGSRGRSG